MKRVIIVGSPRSNGRSAHLAEMLFEANIDERPEDELYLVPVSEIDVGPCIGCGACKNPSPVTFQNDDGTEVTELRNRCVFDDDMQTLYDLLDEADTLTIVCPVYFSGTPAPMKCILDRLQPYFWPYCENGPREPKRPLELHVIGEGGDPHGYAPLVSEVRGSTALAGFRLERILDWVGKISRTGEILEEAEEVELATVLGAPSAQKPTAVAGEEAPLATEGETGALGATDETSDDGLVTAAGIDAQSEEVDAESEGGDSAETAALAEPRHTFDQAKPYAERPKLSFSGAGGNASGKSGNATGKRGYTSGAGGSAPAKGGNASGARGSASGAGTSTTAKGGNASVKGGSASAKGQGQAKGSTQNSPRSKSNKQAQGKSAELSRGEAQGKSQAQSRGKAHDQSQGKGQGQSRGKGQGNSQGKVQGQSRGRAQSASHKQASKPKRGRLGGRDGRHA